MNNEKQRIVLFILISFLLLTGWPILMERLGLAPRPAKPVAQAKKDEAPKAPEKKDAAPAKGKAEAKADAAVAEKPEKGKDAASAPAAKKKDEPPKVKLEDRTLGSATDRSPDGYRLQLVLDQRGAGVDWLASSRFEAEGTAGLRRHLPLQLIEPDLSAAPRSFAILGLGPHASSDADAEPAAEDELAPGDTPGARRQFPLDVALWEIVRDAKGRTIRPLAADKNRRAGQEIVFRHPVEPLSVVVTKTYRLRQGEDGFELIIDVSSPQKTQTLSYRLLGPHGIPIEGEWYTSTFRDVFFGQARGDGVRMVTNSAYDVAKGKDNRQTVPLKFSGVEDQYFAVLLEPEDKVTAETEAVVIHRDAENLQKSDVTVELTSAPFTVGPNAPATHTYRVFAGAKTAEALAPYGAEALANYRKGWTLWGLVTVVANYFISPLLDKIYALTAQVAHLFGGRKGNYGIAIILLTITVRMILFPLGRKQAISAKRMQDLQPHMLALKEKYGDDKERLNREMFALYREHGVNPFGGCWPALIQLPIFIALWQVLNTSVQLRHAPFLPFFIRDLAAPDMLFRLPFEIPWLGHYFNVLPFIVVALMLVQTKLFSPPATTPEAEAQQKMMKYMMIFMAFMFYKVPSGLGLYFITSSLWGIGERLLLPKVAATAAGSQKAPEAAERDSGGKGGATGNGRTPGRGGGNGAPRGWFSEFLERVMEEAEKERTHRNEQKQRGGDRDRDRDKDKDRGRSRPGRKR